MTDRIALVTGAGSGIGHAAALGLVDAGWTVAVAGRRREQLEETAKLAGDNRARVLPVAGDVGNPQDVGRIFDTVREAFGRLDLVFNNAGTGAPPIPLEDLTYEQWQTVVDVNLTGVFLCMQHAFRIMKSQSPKGGRIINNGSISSTSPRPNSAPYTATKHAVSGLTRSGSLDGRKHDIAVGHIDIGNAATDMTQRMSEGVLQADGRTAVEPRMDATHVASAVVYMASLPLDANVQFMTVMATKMPYIGRG